MRGSVSETGEDESSEFSLLAHSPHLNPIEGFWLFFKSHVLSNHMHSDLNALKRTVQRFLRHIEEGKMEGYEFPVKNRKNLFASP